MVADTTVGGLADESGEYRIHLPAAWVGDGRDVTLIFDGFPLEEVRITTRVAVSAATRR
jgi:hypothetical protein